MQGLQWPSPSTSTETTTTIPTTLTHTPPLPPPFPEAFIDFLHAQTDNLRHSIDALSISQNSFQLSLSSQMASLQHTILEMLQRYHKPLSPTRNTSCGPLNATSPWTGLGFSNPPSSPHHHFSSPGSNVSEVWFAPNDPSLPPPWKGVVDGTTQCFYYWNPEMNITQYEKPVYWVSSLSISPSCSADPFYPPFFTASNCSFHSQYPHLYSNNDAPDETVINGYTFPTQFPFPNHTHTSTNQSTQSFSQSQSMVEPIYPEFPSFQPKPYMNPSVPTCQSPCALNPSVPTFVPQIQFPNPKLSFSFLSVGDSESHMVPLELNMASDLAVPTTDTYHSTPTLSPDGLPIPPSISFEEMVGPQLTYLHLEHATKLQAVSETEKQKSMIPLSDFKNAREEYHAPTILPDAHPSKAPFPVELHSSNDAKQQECDHRPLEQSCAAIGGLRTLNNKFEVFASLFDSSHFCIAILALLWKTMDDYHTISNISAQPCSCVFEHESAFSTVNHASLLNFDYKWMSSPLAGWFEKIQRSVTQVLYEKELQNFLLNFLKSFKWFAAAETLLVYESLTRILGSCHSILALQMGLYIILHISSSAVIKPFVLFVFVIGLPNHNTPSTPLLGATYVKTKWDSQGFPVDIVHLGIMSTIYQNSCLKIHMQWVTNHVPTISHAYHHDNYLTRKMGMRLKNCEQHSDGGRTSTNKLVGALEVVKTTAMGQQVEVIAIFIINQSLTVKQIFPLRFDTVMIFLLILDAHVILIICGMTHKIFDRSVLPGAFWSAHIFKGRYPLEPHSIAIITFVLAVVFYHNMQRQVYPILPDLGLQNHRHVLAYFFMTHTVLALFFLMATMLIKDVNGGNFYLLEVIVIPVVLLCQPRSFFIEIIGYLQVKSELFPMRVLKFDHKSLITLTGATAIKLVFDFGEDLHIINSDSHLEYSDSHMEYSILRYTKDDIHLLYSTLWCIPLFTCAIPNNVVWSRSWLLDYISTWDLMIMDDAATLYPLTVLCKVTTQQSKIDEYMVQNYLRAISTWGCFTCKIETQMLLPVLRVISKVGVLVISILLYKLIFNIATMKTFVFSVPAFYVLHRGCARERAAILICSVQASCFEELVKGVSTTHAPCDDHEGAAHAISMPNQTAQVLLSLPPREGNHVMLNTGITEKRMVSAEIFWAHLRHEDMPSFKGGGLVRTISLDT